MKKFILLAMLGIASAIYQPAKAQVSLDLHIGSQPYYPARYYVPARPVYVAQRPVYYARPTYYARPHYVSNRVVYRTNYAQPAYRYKEVKREKFHGNKHYGRGNRGRH